MNPLDLIDFGADISKVRSEIDENIKLLKLKKTYVGLHKKLMSSESKYVKQNTLLQQSPEKAINSLGFFSHIFFIPILEAIKATPYKIHPFFVMVTEALYYLSNQDKLLKFLDSPDEQLGNYYRKLYIEHGRFMNPFQNKVMQFFMNEDEASEDIKLIEKQVDAKEKSFNFLFAATIRQIPLLEIKHFLTAQKAIFPIDSDFNEFLELTVLEYKELISEKSRMVITKWLATNPPNKTCSAKIPSNKINADIIETRKEIEFTELPDGWVRITGKLKPFQIADFLSFFKDETNGCPTGASFFTDEEYDLFIEYGLAYPTVEPEKKAIQYKRSTRKSYGILYHMLFKLFEKNKPIDAAADYKMQYALFIKHRIGGINASLQSILDNMDNERPAKLAQEMIDKYVAKLKSNPLK